MKTKFFFLNAQVLFFSDNCTRVYSLVGYCVQSVMESLCRHRRRRRNDGTLRESLTSDDVERKVKEEVGKITDRWLIEA